MVSINPKSKKTGRNSPCPCGSGKKYKKCCIDKNPDTTDIEALPEKPLPPYSEIDFGVPKIDDEFLDSTPISEMSAQRLLYSNLLEPRIEGFAAQFTRPLLQRGEAEKKRIENAENAEELLAILNGKVDSINHAQIKEKMIQFKEEAVPLLLEELKQNHTSQFVELAVRIIHGSGIPYSKEIRELLKNFPFPAYKTSQLCLLLGFVVEKENEVLLWNYYHYFKKHHPGKTYCDGPFLGMSEMKVQEKERKGHKS